MQHHINKTRRRQQLVFMSVDSFWVQILSLPLPSLGRLPTISMPKLSREMEGGSRITFRIGLLWK
jgi:hypothetical protein